MLLPEMASVIRSKNAGPLHVTFDIMFSSESYFRAAEASENLGARRIAQLYGVEADRVSVIPYAPARAIKIVIDRPIVAGSPGDCDVYGAQQHRPLLEISI